LDSGNLFRIHLRERGDEVRIMCFRVEPTVVTLCWRTEPGHTYYIEHKPTLTHPDWTPASGAIIPEGTQANWTGPRPPGNSAVYRVVKLAEQE
jgi:hypothetical protein